MANWIENLKKKVKMFLAGEELRRNPLRSTIKPIPETKLKPMEKIQTKDFKTVRTQAIEDELRRAGIDEKMIARLRGKIKR